MLAALIVPALLLDAAFGDGKADPRLEHAREVVLAYVSHMPNYVADETAKRYQRDPGSSKWRVADTIQTEITLRENSAVRENIRRNGKPWKKPFDELPGFKWAGRFGTELRPLFDPQCPTTLDFAGSAEVHGQPVLDYQFSSPQDGCFAYFTENGRTSNPPRSGDVFIDQASGNVMRLEEDAEGFPPGSRFIERTEQVTWGYVTIGEERHLLPIAASFLIRYASGTQYRIDVEYSNHRHFEASTHLTFQ